MKTINNLNNGMSSDLAKQFYKADTYLQALNFRGLTEMGSSNGSLVNIKGNECKVSFPDLQPVFKLLLVKGSDLVNNNNTITFTINGITSLSYTITNETTGFDIYTFIVNNFTQAYQNPIVTTKTFAIAYEDDYIVIYSQPVYTNCSSVASILPSIIVNQTIISTKATLVFTDQKGSTSNTQDLTKPYVVGTLSKDIIPIGSTFILNDIYILTAPNDPSYGPAGTTGEKPPHDELQSNGAIWKLTIDDITKQHTLTLIYYNNLDFTKYHPIPPSAISGRYESKEIQRIYWSDNYNKIRTLNVAMEQLMAVRPFLLNVMPRVEMTQPILNSIIGGSLTKGSYQLAYRLSNVLGAVTNFSELSNPVYITPTPEGAPFEQYEGGLLIGTETTKGIVWKLDPLDLSYSQIETIVVFKSAADAVPVITSMGLSNVTSSKLITYINSADASYDTITLDEFLLFNGTFTHAKTCDTKDNRLFWGNVRSPKKELESYDSRAFRSNDDNKIVLTNGPVVDVFNTYNDAAALPQTADAINEYYLPNGDYSTNACYLKPGGGGILGGKGVNISYEFGTQVFISDSEAGIAGSDNWDLYNSHSGSPYKKNNGTNTSPSNLIYTYPQNNKFESLKQPERTSLLKGFQHEEIYRFGIQFFDLELNPYFTKWIGDIKMPSYGDFNNNPGGSVNDFRLSYFAGVDNICMQILYIKFTVDVTQIQNVISGYQIVRVKRDDFNKTILGNGLITPLMSQTGNDGGSTICLPAGWYKQQVNYFDPTNPGVLTPYPYYNPFPSQNSVETLNLQNDGPGNPNFARFKTFDCFDFDYDNGVRPSRIAGDRLLIRNRLQSINFRNGGLADSGYRQYFAKSTDSSGDAVPGDTTSVDDGTTGPFTSKTNNDNTHQPYFIMKMVDYDVFCTYQNFITPNSNIHDYALDHSEYITGNGNSSGFYGGYNAYNQGLDISNSEPNPCYGKRSLFTVIGSNRDNSRPTLYTSVFPYDCTPSSNPFYKLCALYYRPNSSLYGGATYISRSQNEYIPCGEYIPLIRNGLPTTYNNFTYKVFGGDVFTTTQDMQKTVFNPSSGPKYYVYEYNPSFPFNFVRIAEAQAKFSTSFFFPSTGILNSELRYGLHINKSLTSEMGYGEDSYEYNTYCNAENDTKVYFPKPLNFQSTDEWINRIYWSELKFNNEIQDSWSEYLTDHFYDVEGNYGGINALISLKENMYYIQERGVGSLMINPVSLINDSLGQSVKLGGSAIGSPVIQKHYYKAIDAGTFHQWSVYRSQSAITFVDARHKKIYIFDGEAVTPISDIKGQRNFTIKRLHNELLKYDNPVINKGILSTYDYYNNEFLYTFNNILEEDITNNENLTLAYSEVLNAFTGLYSFAPNLYINSNKYIISTIHPVPTDTNNKLWFHNYGSYGVFYNIRHPSTLKLLVNDNPLTTKVFDNITLSTESIKDNVEWNDDYNVYPGSPTNPLYPDDINNQTDTFNKVRCYNDWQNTDWTTLTLAPPGNTLTRKERNFNLQVPRNKFNYDIIAPSVSSLFNPTYLNKLIFGERIRDKYLIIDLEYPNTTGNRFIVNNIETIYRVSDR